MAHVAMERTGEDWKPVDNISEGIFTAFLVNAVHVQQVPGRQTDKADARWLAKLMRYGWLQASFTPPAGQCDLHDLTHDRTKLVQERGREVNRVHGVLEPANMKLAAVAMNIFGVSGRAMLTALSEGRADPATMTELAKGRLLSKIPLLEQALTGLVRDHYRRVLMIQLVHLDCLDEQIDALTGESTRILAELSGGEPPGALHGASPPEGQPSTEAQAPLTFARAVSVLATIPGVDREAELLVAEWGTDMARFGTAERLSAWSGVAPGNDESAGKRRSATSRNGNRALRAGLIQVGHAAARTEGTYLSTLDHRLAARRGKKQEILVVADAIVVSAFHLRSRHEPYRELGPTTLTNIGATTWSTGWHGASSAWAAV